MSEKDKNLISQAWKTSCYQWNSIDSLIEKAESEGAKEKLRTIMNYKYQMERYSN